MAPYIMEEYIKACKAGKRDYQARMMNHVSIKTK